MIEDDRRSADLLQLYLEDAGYRVAVARDGVDGLDLARRLAPTAVVLDVLLPRLNGWDVLARLKRDPATAAIPVVVVSMLDERGAGFALGAAEYLVKPVDHEELLARGDALRHAAGRRRGPSSRSTTTRSTSTSSRRCSARRAGRSCARWAARRACGSSPASGPRSCCSTC